MSNQVIYTQRQQQIIDATLKLISERGLQGATIGRIAAEIGISEPALYRHFKNRREIILASLDAITRKICDYFTTPDVPDAIGRIRNSTLSHNEEVMMHKANYIHPLFEFFVAPYSDEMHGPLEETMKCILNAIEECVKDGISEGIISDKVDSELASFYLFSHGLMTDVAYLTGINSLYTFDKSKVMLERFLDHIINKQ